MYCDVIILTFLTIPLVNSHSNILPMLDDQDTVERFNRHDLPSFTYEDGYQVSTPPPIMGPDPIAQNIYNNIQYAPLNTRNNQRTKNIADEYTKITPSLGGASTPKEPLLYTRSPGTTSISSVPKSHLEPRVPNQMNAEAMKCYSPGQSVEVLTVSRSPGHNAIYRSFPEPVPRDNKLFKLNNFVRSFGVYHDIEPVLTTTLATFELPSENVARPFSMNQNYGLNPNNMEAGPGIDKKKRQYSPYAKLHRLHLNIARVYSPGQVVPPQAPPFTDTYSMNYQRLPVHPKAYAPSPYQGLSKKPRYVYPDQEKQKGYRFRLP
ncbi:uncharacterized protein LOC118262017 [Spodoptera frugiperda]|uniref:Uncharacterized protein LOC118262017 n=1 Tax=Spodoptera frugiperda TaxID=7108 RepID=A0A9R0CTM3_SPOFR|nr:uncharacterized protein LOC118262017 [Spodoptera frugiperda]